MRAMLDEIHHFAPDAVFAWAGWLIHSSVHTTTHAARRAVRHIIRKGGK